MAFEIPVETDDPHFTQVTSLDGTEFRLEFRFNEREQRFYMDLRDGDGVDILVGVRLTVDWAPLRYLVDPRRPLGEIFITDSEGEGRDPRLGDLGDRVKLFYLTGEELGRAA